MGVFSDEQITEASRRGTRGSVAGVTYQDHHPMQITFRPATESDTPEIVALLNDLGYESEVSGIRARLSTIRTRRGEVIVALSDDNVVGCVHVFLDIRLAEGETGEIVSLVVDNRYRGSGIGAGLLTQAKSWVLEHGCTTMRVRANSIRTEAHQFYIEQGFIEIKTQKIFQAVLAQT